MPDIVIAANTVTVAPPSTGCGMVVISAPNFGQKPAASITRPTIRNTRLATTLVVQIRPTFWLYGSVGRPPITAPIMPQTDWPLMAPPSSLSVASRLKPPIAVEDTSPMVCTACTTYISTIMMIASGWNARPKWNGTGTETQPA